MFFFKQKWTFIAVLLAGLVGCAASGPEYVTPPELSSADSNMARVFFYREKTFAGAAWPVTFSIDRTKVMSVRAGGYSYMLVKPGTHLLHLSAIDDLGMEITAELEAGEEYFFRFALNGSALPPEAIVDDKTDWNQQSSAAGGASITVNTQLQFLQVKKLYAQQELAREGFKYSQPLMESYLH